MLPAPLMLKGGEQHVRQFPQPMMFRTAPTCRDWSKNSCSATTNAFAPTTKVSLSQSFHSVYRARERLIFYNRINRQINNNNLAIVWRSPVSLLCHPFISKYICVGLVFWYTGWPKKVGHHQFFKKSYYRLPTRLDLFVKLWIKHYNTILLLSLTMLGPQSSDMRYMQ